MAATSAFEFLNPFRRPFEPITTLPPPPRSPPPAPTHARAHAPQPLPPPTPASSDVHVARRSAPRNRDPLIFQVLEGLLNAAGRAPKVAGGLGALALFLLYRPRHSTQSAATGPQAGCAAAAAATDAGASQPIADAPKGMKGALHSFPVMSSPSSAESPAGPATPPRFASYSSPAPAPALDAVSERSDEGLSAARGGGSEDGGAVLLVHLRGIKVRILY